MNERSIKPIVLDITVKAENAETDALKVLKVLRSDWKESELEFKVRPYFVSCAI